MIQADLIKYLSRTLEISVSAEKPTKKPKEYVVIELIDSGRIDYIDSATFSIMSYSDSLLNAAKLNDKVIDAMYEIDIDYISHVKLGGGSQAIDKQTKEYAYDSIFNIYYMKE